MSAKILVVDDEREDLDRMRSLLEKAGHDVSTAPDGARALDTCAGGNYDLVLIDIKMPTLTGYDLLRLLKERCMEDTRLLFVSIVPKKEVRYLDELDGFIQKPFTDEGFISAINRSLEVSS